MNGKLFQLLLCLLAGFLLAVPATNAWGEEDPPAENNKQNQKPPAAETDNPPQNKEAKDEPRPDGDRARSRRRSMLSYDRRFERDHALVLDAFRDVVREPRLSTVAILANGTKQRALGAIVDSSGYVITKYSEIAGDSLHCRLHDGRRLPAKLIGSDAASDLALLQIEADNLVPLKWSEDSEPVVGSWLATVSQALLPAAIGVVSAAPRKIARPGRTAGRCLGRFRRRAARGAGARQ